MIIGLTGPMASGKGEVVKYLQIKGFEHYVYSDLLKERARKMGIELTRKNLQKLGNDIKKEKKNLGILSRMMLKRIKTDKAAVDGIRNVDEIKEFRKKMGFYLIGVSASPMARFKRIRKRGREGDPETFEDFKKSDNLENRGKTKSQEINKCMKMADFVITNDGSLDKLKKDVDRILETISGRT